MILRAVFVVAVECPLAPFELAVWLSLAESVGISASTTTELIKDSFRGVVMLRSCVAFLVDNGAGQHYVLPHALLSLPRKGLGRSALSEHDSGSGVS